MIVRILQRTRLEAAMARLGNWWNGLSPRERVLVGTLGTLLGLAILVYGIVKPIQAERADARADIRQFETLNARIRAAGTLPAAQPPAASGPPEMIVSTAATRVGLAAPAVAIPGGARASVTDAPYETVVRWLDEVTRTSTLGATRVSIVRGAAAGRVSATVEFGS